MSELIIRGAPPSTAGLVDAVYATAEILGIWECYAHEGRYHFSLGGGWSIALSADSANRIRLESCRLTHPVSRMWVFVHRRDRLAGLVRRMGAVPEVA